MSTTAPAPRPVRKPLPSGPETRARLLAAAGEAFAERGFRDASLRDICRRAHANVAAVNYHFRSKELLYQEVLRESFEQTGRDRPLVAWPTPPKDLEEARERLRFVIRRLAETLIEPGAARPRLLLLREMLEPSPALGTVLEEFVRPRCRAVESALAPFLPGASARVLSLHAISVMGQVVYHRCATPVALALLGEAAYTPALVDEIADHVLRFTERALGAAS